MKRSASARRLTAFAVKRFWKPVGAGIMPDAELYHLSAYAFGDAEGFEEARRVDETISRLPGMEWFDGLSRFIALALREAAEQGFAPDGGSKEMLWGH